MCVPSVASEDIYRMQFRALDPKTGKYLELQDYQDDVRFSRARNTGFWAGWRTGKSYGLLGFAEVSMAANPGCRGGIIEPDYKMLDDFIETRFVPSFRPYIQKTERGKYYTMRNFMYKIKFKNGSDVIGLSGHNLDKLEQYELGWCIIDEAGIMKRDIFVRANARVADPNARRPRLCFAGTPRLGWPADVFEDRDDDDRCSFHVSTERNKYLTRDYIDGLYNACPSRLRAALIGGQFVAMGDVVWPEFSEEHVIPWKFERLIKHRGGITTPAIVVCAIDWSPRRPHVLWIQRIPAGAIMPGGWIAKRDTSVVIDEIYPDGRFHSVSTHALCEMIQQRKAPDGMPYRLESVVVDPAGRAVQETSNLSNVIIAERMLKVPILYLPGQSIMVGIQHVSLALGPSVGHPYLYFSDYLRRNQDPCAGRGNPDDDETKQRGVLRSMTGYAYEEGIKDRLPETPFHDTVFSHAADALRYYVRFYHPEDMLSVETWKAR